MAGARNLITGATGLLGSHLAEQLVARGEQVRALVRPASDVSFLKRLGVDLVTGDLTDPESLRRAVDGIDVVFHSAAKVGDWGPWSAFQAEVIDATRNLARACRDVGVRRLVHVSSITVYGSLRARPGQLITEDEPLAEKLGLWDYYRRAKIAAERLVWDFVPQATIARPSWMYGPRDRTSLPRVVKALRQGRAALVGKGDNFLNIIHVADVADGVLRAADHPAAAGQAYNFSSEGEITQRELLDFLCDELGLPHIRRHWPYRVAYGLGLFAEVVARGIRMKRPPRVTRYVVSLVGRPTQFSIAKARDQLGWQPRIPVREGIHQSLDDLGLRG